MSKLFLPLLWKFIIGIVTVVTIFGLVNIYFTRNLVYNSLENEIQKRGLFIAKNLAERSINSIMYDDIVSLYKFVEDVSRIDSSVVYVLIINNKGEVLAHSFENKVPQELIKANRLGERETESAILIQDKHKEKELIRDIAVPILDGDIGTVRVGLSEKNIHNDLNNTIRSIIFMILVLLVIGIIVAFVFSLVITTPIIHISKMADKIDINSLKISFTKQENISDRIYRKIRQQYYIEDEIDILSRKFHDMLERLEITYKELQLTQASLFHSEKLASIGTLTAGIAHEINNPIAGLRNCIYRISKAPDNIKQNEKYIEMMIGAIDKIEEVLRRLLNFSRKHDFSLSELDITNVIENVIKLATYKLEKSKISILTIFPEKIPPIKGSANHLEQVMLNLVLNSIDAIDEMKAKKTDLSGEIAIRIELKDSNIHCSVIDNGTGIPSDMINNIFNPFFTTKRVNEGTGLGLSISYNIIKEHDGEITVESEYGKGAVFTLVLPIKPDE